MLPFWTTRGNSRATLPRPVDLRSAVAQPNKPLVVLAVLGAIVLAVVFGTKALGPSFTGSAGGPLVTLDSTKLGDLRTKFDTARDSTRLLVLLSPT
jgi:hypothetical protein